MVSIYFFLRKFIKFQNYILKLLRRFVYFIESLHTGVFIGLLNHKHLSKIDQIHYGAHKGYYKDDYNKGELFDFEQEAINNFFKDCKSILVTAAGGGREMYMLIKMGYEVTGYEYNKKLRNYANALFSRENIDAVVLPAERDKGPLTNKTFDGVIVGYGSYLHIKGSSTRIAFLKKVSESLKKGGIILVSFYVNKDSRMNLERIYRIGNFVANITKNEKVERGDSLDVEYVHYFSGEEIMNELTQAGFIILNYSEVGFGNVVARKKI